MLPREAELRNWAARGLEAKGEVLLDSMSRLKAVVTRAAFPATARIRCRKDEQYRYIVEVEAEMTVTLQCQRCLGDCEKELTTTSTLCVLWTEDAVNELPVDYDPLIAGDVSNLHAIIEDELFLTWTGTIGTVLEISTTEISLPYHCLLRIISEVAFVIFNRYHRRCCFVSLV